jgi:hypothetical protein
MWSADVSADVSAFRRDQQLRLALRRLDPDAPLWSRAVVLEELYAGIGDRDRKGIEQMERDFEKTARLLVPNPRDST